MARNFGDIVELVFTAPVTRPTPFGVVAVDEATWAVPLLDDLDIPADAAAPWPGLTAFGTGCHGNMLLLNLATARPLVVTSIGEHAAQVVRAVSLDLARSPWADRVHIHLVGFGAELATARPDRATHHEHLGLAVQAIAHECWGDSYRGTTPRAGLHVLLCSQPNERHNTGLGELLQIYPNVTAVLAETKLSTSLIPAAHIDSDQCRLSAADASWFVTPRRVPASAYAHSVAALPPPPGQSPDHYARGRPVPVRDETPRLELRLLGQPEIVGIDTSAVDRRALNQTTQLACYLALHPDSTAGQIGRALVPDAQDNEIYVRFSRARKLLGRDHLPAASDHRYRLAGVRIDRDEFYRLINRAKARTAPRAATDLEQALALVSGCPLGEPGSRRYAWARPHAERMLRDILDACHQLATIHLDTRQPREAWKAAHKALSLDDINPTATQDLFRSLHALGEYNQLYQARDHYEKTCGDRGFPTDRATVDTLLHPPR